MSFTSCIVYVWCPSAISLSLWFSLSRIKFNLEGFRNCSYVSSFLSIHFTAIEFGCYKIGIILRLVLNLFLALYSTVFTLRRCLTNNWLLSSSSFLQNEWLIPYDRSVAERRWRWRFGVLWVGKSRVIWSWTSQRHTRSARSSMPTAAIRYLGLVYWNLLFLVLLLRESLDL